ncbi:MAG: hypothetical protein A2X94_16680 [Bdellovibrionales bacterium GWB1_55_8]|nr:MAG: hypothetical protein A2X94_16680 [Bdellovibrionales bacterium GWB1_55_8]
MNRSMIAIVACSAVIGMSACSKNSKNPVPFSPPAPQAAQGPAYKVVLSSKCVEESDEYCVGQYGFLVTADGTFEVGPGPAGQRKSGRISDDELKMIDAAVIAAVGGIDLNRAESCNEVDALASEDTVTISMSNGDVGLVRASGTNFCFQTATVEQAEALHKAIRELADKYYTLPFPDACEDAVEAIEALYPEMQKCSADTDCAYVTTNYDVIPPSSSQYVTTDACSKVKPLVVGNIAAIIQNQTKAYEALDQARYVCGERIIRYDCTGISGFMSSDGAPVCDTSAQMCRINPALNIH